MNLQQTCDKVKKKLKKITINFKIILKKCKKIGPLVFNYIVVNDTNILWIYGCTFKVIALESKYKGSNVPSIRRQVANRENSVTPLVNVFA